MPNIPGVAGYTQPGVFARDRVISRGVSIPGGIRIACIMGEGLREEVLVSPALGSGQDGSIAISPTGSGDSKYFRLANYPVVSGRTELYLNGSLLFGTEDQVDTTSFSSKFDYRVDTDTGAIELQSASIGDQDGRGYSASSLNIGNGVITEGACGTTDLISLIDSNAPNERWTIRCVAVSRDSNGDPMPGKATFTATGSVSGQVRDSNGQPIFWDSNAWSSNSGAVSGSLDVTSDGFIVADSDDFSTGNAVDRSASGDSTPDTTTQFTFTGDLVSQGQALVGDHLCVDGYTGIEITDISYSSATNLTTLTLETDSLHVGGSTTNVGWEIRATNLLIDDPSVLHNGATGAPASDGSFVGSDVGKTVIICSGDAAGKYKIDAVTSTRRVRLSNHEDSSAGFPDTEESSGGLIAGSGSTQFYLMRDNGVVLFGIQYGSVPFEVGDKFFIDVNSRVLTKGDVLEARYIAQIDLNDPQLFVSANELFNKHGTPSLTNTLSLGAQMAFENTAPAILALQCKPPLPRRTSVTLLEPVDNSGDGGFSGGNELDDLYFPIPMPISGLRKGMPDGDTQVNIFVVDGTNGSETQIFPNRVAFYNTQYDNATGQNSFVSSSDTSYSYTIVNTDTEILGQGFNGEITASTNRFSTLEMDFDADHVGSIIVVQSLEDSGGTAITSSSGAGSVPMHLFSDGDKGVELVITGIVDDSTVTVRCDADALIGDGGTSNLTNDSFDVQFYVKDASSTSTGAALLIHSDIVDNGTLSSGDGIRISYIDRNDADFYDVNWSEAFEALEAASCQIVVPLPTQNRSGIFRASVTHVENMSTIANQRERITMFGAQQGMTAEALIGVDEIAVEDIGVLEGIQGDDPEEVLSSNVEDLVNATLNENHTSKRSVYFFPDRIVRNVAGTNTYIDGFYMAAAAAGLLSGTQNVAVPLTYKTLSGFSILRDRTYRQTIQNALGNVGATLVTPVSGGGKVLHGRTNSITGFVEDEEISVIFIRDRVKAVLRDSLRGFLGKVEDENTQGLIGARVGSIMSALISQGLITSYENIKVERDKVDPRQWNVFVRFQPAYPINYVFVDIEVGVL